MNAIAENVSIKPKRGRPYLLFNDANDKRKTMEQYDDVRSERSVINRMYRWYALSVLGDGRKPEFIWLADAKADRFKYTILTELGRIVEDEEIRDLAGDICEMKMRTSEAVAFIREYRGVSKPASAEWLEEALRSRMDRWLNANGKPEQIVDVLRTLMTEFESSTRPVPATAAQGAGR